MVQARKIGWSYTGTYAVTITDGTWFVVTFRLYATTIFSALNAHLASYKSLLDNQLILMYLLSAGSFGV